MRYKVETKTVLCEVTYRRGNLAAVNFKRGAFSLELIKILPLSEALIDKEWMHPIENKRKKTNHFYKEALRLWNDFFVKRSGLPYRFTVADGVALSKIGKHLASLHAGDEKQALLIWEYLLKHWDKLDEFYRNTPDLKFINSQLNRILIQLKNGKEGISQAGKADDADDLRREFTN